MWRRRKAKKKFFGTKIYLGITVLLIIVLIIPLLLKTGLFNVKSVEVKADHLGCTDENQLKDASGLFGQNIFRLDQKKLAETFRRKFICVKDVSLLKVFPASAQIKVTGRQPTVIMATLNEGIASPSSSIENIATPSAADISDNFVVDSEGVVFSKNIDNLNIPRVFVTNLNLSLGEKIKSEFLKCLEILEKVKTFGLNVRESFINDDLFIVSPEAPGPKIIFRLNDNLDIQLASLQLILAKAKINAGVLEFIDLRFDKPVVKFAPKK